MLYVYVFIFFFTFGCLSEISEKPSFRKTPKQLILSAALAGAVADLILLIWVYTGSV